MTLFGHQKSFKKPFLIIVSLTTSILAFAILSQQFLQHNTLSSQNNAPMTESQKFPSPSPLSNDQRNIITLEAKDFHFEARLEFPPSVSTTSDQYTEQVTAQNNGRFHLTLIPLGQDTKYLFQVSHQPCSSNGEVNCQPEEKDRIQRGNIAEIQLTLLGNQLKLGTYPLGKGGITPQDEIIMVARQLYSDPSHGQLGCQMWGEGTLTINKVVYDDQNTLKSLEAHLSRVCEQTTPFSPTLPTDNLPEIKTEKIENYTYHVLFKASF